LSNCPYQPPVEIVTPVVRIHMAGEHGRRRLTSLTSITFAYFVFEFFPRSHLQKEEGTFCFSEKSRMSPLFSLTFSSHFPTAPPACNLQRKPPTQSHAMPRIALAAAIFILTAAPALAFNKATHMISGAIAYHVLRAESPQTLQKVIALLEQHPDFGRFKLDTVAAEDRDL
jgi:hypothetical protein